MDYYEENFKPLKHMMAYKLTHPLFDQCKDHFRVGCYRKTKFGYIVYCKNLQKDKIVAVFSNTKLKREIEKVDSFVETEDDSLVVPLDSIVFSTLGMENDTYMEHTYRRLFFQ